MIRRSIPAVLLLAALAAGCHKQEAGQPKAVVVASGPVAPPPAAGWADTVVETADGGFMMGSPDAPLKIVEYGSLTCPHCADFAAEAYPALEANYIASGKVSLELRNYVRDGVDIAATLISRCAGPGPYFKLTEQIFAAQKDWYAKLQSLTKEQQAALTALPESQQTEAVAEAAGLTDLARQRGIPSGKLKACLNDKAAVDKLIATRDAAVTKYNIEATPTFLFNGENIGSLDAAGFDAKVKQTLG